jgi:hypothetical protein
MRVTIWAGLAASAIAIGCTSHEMGPGAARSEEAPESAEAAERRAHRAANSAERARDSAQDAEGQAWDGALDAKIAASVARDRPLKNAPPRRELAAWPRAKGARAPAPARATAPARARARPKARRASWVRSYPLERTPSGTRRIHVDGRRAGMSQDGTRRRPYLTIAAALERAQRGDQLLVAPAVYQESVHLPAGIALIGRRGDPQRWPTRRVVLKGQLKLSSRTRVQDVEVVHEHSAAARAVIGRGLDNVILRRVDVRAREIGDRGYVVGMDFRECRRLVLDHCRVLEVRERAWGSACGIRLVGCQAQLLGNRVESVHETDWGIARGILALGCELTLRGNVVHDVRETAWSDAVGIHLHQTLARLEHTTVVSVHGDAWESAVGIRIDNGCRVHVRASLVGDVQSERGSVGIDNRSNRAVVELSNVWGVSGSDHRGRAMTFSGARRDCLELKADFDGGFRLADDSPLRSAFKDRVEGGLHLGAGGATNLDPVAFGKPSPYFLANQARLAKFVASFKFEP